MGYNSGITTMGGRAGGGARGGGGAAAGARGFASPDTWLGKQQAANAKAYGRLNKAQKAVFDHMVSGGFNGKETIGKINKYYKDAARLAGKGASPKEVANFINGAIMANY